MKHLRHEIYKSPSNNHYFIVNGSRSPLSSYCDKKPKYQNVFFERGRTFTFPIIAALWLLNVNQNTLKLYSEWWQEYK